MDTTLSPPAGQLLDGRYLVESRLARGGMATVYLGRDTRLDRTVALKIAHSELARDQEFVRRFITEARAVAQLSSPHVVAVFDQGSAGNVLYIAMEYVAGPTLREVLNARGSLSVRESLDVIEGVLMGLAAGHRAGIIHRDVKPENVLLGKEGAVKVADFGLARAAAAATHTKTGMIIGTAAYLAPEQVSRSTSDARTDVYAAGVMLFEMLTGTQPHTGESPLAVAYKHVNDVVPAPSSLVPELPPALDALVALATSRDPDLRPADAGQFLHAITQVRHGAPLSATRRGQHAAPYGPEHGNPRGLAGAGVAGPDPGPGATPESMADTDLGPAVGGALVLGSAIPSLATSDRDTDRDRDLGSGSRSRSQPGASGARHALGSGGGGDGFEATSGLIGLPGGRDDAQPANHTLVVSAGTIVPGFGESEHDRRYRRLGGYRPDGEPPLQRLLFSRRLIYVLGGLAVVLTVVLLAWWLSAGQYTNVPQVTGWSAGLARTELTGLGFKVHDNAGQHSNVQVGHIIKTSPAAGTKVKSGGTIALTLSLGPVKLKVPSVTGVPLAQAQQELRSAGLTAGTVQQTPSTTISAGLVISTDPVAGTLWPKNKAVGLTVSSGQPLPSFVGQQVSAAQATAAAGGYLINPVADAKSDQPVNTITRQSPAAGSPIQSGEVVQVYFSPGPPQVNVPNVQGMHANDAQAALVAAGFTVTVNKVGPGDRVFSYGPQGAQPAGTNITINVGFSFL